jgi:ornithine carbamoyltransferase
MHKNLKPPIAQQRKRATRPDTNAVLACAAGMRSAASPGITPRPLRGQNLGLLCAGGQAQAIEAFRDAAAGLGANVAIIRSDLNSASTAQTVLETARLLSRLYDAVECYGLPDAVADELARTATVAVTSGHVAAAEQVDLLANLLEGSDSWEHKRRDVLQALVMQCMC